VSNILVIGASKGIGLRTVNGALKAGHKVRAFARSAHSIEICHPKLEKFQGDALNVKDVERALNGIDVVIQALGVSPGPGVVFGPVTLFSQAARLLVPAMEKLVARRLIAVTGFGSGDSQERISCLQRLPFRLIFGRAYDDKSIQERLIRDSDLDWTIVRPVVLTNGPKTGRYKILSNPHQWRNGLISRSDVADFLINQIDDETYLHKAPVLSY
jgi:putative NADH-flavin reductase